MLVEFVIALILPLGTLLLPETWPAWGKMWLLAIAVYAGCKGIMWQRRPTGHDNWKSVLLWWCGWPGMAIGDFLPRQTQVVPPTRREWTFAILKTFLGAAILGGLLRNWAWGTPYVAGWVGMIGIAFLLHFGMFHLLSCAWRQTGRAAEPLMHWPIAARNIADFWGRRWNAAFRDVAQQAFFRPLARRYGTTLATWAVFVFSGVVHEIAITVPVQAALGLPMLYFLIQAAGLMCERSDLGRGLGLGTGLRGRLFAIAVVVLPVPLLFPPPFVCGVVLPFLHAVGAAPAF